MKKLKIVLVILILGILGGAFWYAANLRITTVVYEGNERMSEEELDERIFTEKYDKNPLVFYYKTKYKEQPLIPFVDRYDVEMKSLDSVTITVYEKNMIGYVKYMGAYLYFDKDGIIVESSDEKLSDMTYVTGVNFDYFILDEKLPVKDDKIFSEVLMISQQLDKYDLKVNRLHISENMEISLYMKKVIVELGVDDDTMNDKIVELRDMQENLKGLSGTLNMKVYNEAGTGYTFKKSE